MLRVNEIVHFLPADVKDNMIRDLYQSLEISPGASDEEVKRAYRRVALLYHPDRGQAGVDAEERIREANYAYSILGDREKRKRYDLYLEFMRQAARWGLSPSLPHDRILTDLFLDPKFPGLGIPLDEILRAKDLTGYGPIFRALSRAAFQVLRHIHQQEKRRRGNRTNGSRPRIASVLKKVGSAFIPLDTARRPHPSPREGPVSGKAREGDIEWTLPLTREEAAQGTRLTFSYYRDSRWDRLSLIVPPGTREGVRLRVRSKGNHIASSGNTGDLYLRVMFR